MRSILGIATCAALALIPGARAQVAAGATQEQGITRQQADQILQELRQIRQLLERQQQQQPAGPPAKIKMNLEGAPVLGDKNAPITMVEFTDYQCPFCRQLHADLRRA